MRIEENVRARHALPLRKWKNITGIYHPCPSKREIWTGARRKCRGSIF
jgi:hypothetical protein